MSTSENVSMAEMSPFLMKGPQAYAYNVSGTAYDHSSETKIQSGQTILVSELTSKALEIQGDFEIPPLNPVEKPGCNE